MPLTFFILKMSSRKLFFVVVRVIVVNGRRGVGVRRRRIVDWSWSRVLNRGHWNVDCSRAGVVHYRTRLVVNSRAVVLPEGGVRTEEGAAEHQAAKDQGTFGHGESLDKVFLKNGYKIEKSK